MSTTPDSVSGNPFRAWLDTERGRTTRLATFADCSPSHITSIATGRRKPGGELLRTIVVFTGLTIDDVLWPWRDDFVDCHTVEDGRPGAPARPQSEGDCGVAS